MYVCWECWRAEMEFKAAFFFQVLFEIFSTYFFDTRRMSRHFRRIFRPERSEGRKIHRKCRDIRRVLKNSRKIKKSMRKKTCLNFIGASQHSKQTYIGHFVYQGVALNTLGTNGLSRNTLGTSGLSMRKC